MPSATKQLAPGPGDGGRPPAAPPVHAAAVPARAAAANPPSAAPPAPVKRRTSAPPAPPAPVVLAEKRAAVALAGKRRVSAPRRAGEARRTSQVKEQLPVQTGTEPHQRTRATQPICDCKADNLDEGVPIEVPPPIAQRRWDDLSSAFRAVPPVPQHRLRVGSISRDVQGNAISDRFHPMYGLGLLTRFPGDQN
eukprot:6165224-Prymnesium_polylepis.1